MIKQRINRLIFYLVILIGLNAFMLGVVEAGGFGLSAREFKSMLDHKKTADDLILLDIRTPQEFAKGRIKGAMLIDYYGGEFVERLKKLDRNRTYLIYCRSGNRTGRSLAIFKRLGFTQVYHLEGGLIGWVKERYPLDRQIG